MYGVGGDKKKVSQTSALMADAGAHPVTAEEPPQVPTATAGCVLT